VSDLDASIFKSVTLNIVWAGFTADCQSRLWNWNHFRRYLPIM